MQCATGNALGMTRPLNQSLAERIDRFEIGAHPFAHNLRRDIDHVGMTDAALVNDVGHLPAGCQFSAAEFVNARLGDGDTLPPPPTYLPGSEESQPLPERAATCQRLGADRPAAAGR